MASVDPLGHLEAFAAEDRSIDASQRIAQLKNIQRRTHMSPSRPMGGPQRTNYSMDTSVYGLNSINVSQTQDSLRSPPVMSSQGYGAPGGNMHGMPSTQYLSPYDGLVSFLRSADTSPEQYIAPHMYADRGLEGDRLQELVVEISALKQRDQSSTSVLRMAKENLEQRNNRIRELQDQLDRQGATMTPHHAAELQATESALKDMTKRFLEASEQNKQLKAALELAHAEQTTSTQGEAFKKEAEEALNLVERLKQASLRKDEELQEAKAEIDALRSRAAQSDNKPSVDRQHANARSERGMGMSAEMSADVERAIQSKTEQVKELQEVIASEAVVRQEMDEEMAALRKELKDLQILLKSQSDDINYIQGSARDLEGDRMDKERQLARERQATAELQDKIQEQNSQINELRAKVSESVEQELLLAKQAAIIKDLEERQRQLDGYMDGLADERESMQAVIDELKQKRLMVQQKDALIQELNQQVHASNVAGDTSGPALFRVQQMQRDIQELRSAVQHRDNLIAELSSRLQNEGGADLARSSNIAERERALAAQTQQLQLVSQHQYEMQAQLAAVQQALQEQQSLLATQSEQQSFERQQSYAMAAQSQQLAALQHGINSIHSGGPNSLRPGQMPLSLAIDQGGMNGAFEPQSPQTQPNSRQLQVAKPQQTAPAFQDIPKTPTPEEWSNQMGVDDAAQQAQKARALARSAAAAASAARQKSGLNSALPKEVTM